MKGAKLLVYVVLVDLAAIGAFLGVSTLHVPDPWVGTFLLATLVALAGATPVRIPAMRTTITATDPFVFTAIAAFGPLPACVVALAGVLGSALGRDRNRQPMRLAFNLGNVVLTTAVASIGYLLAGGEPGTAVSGQIWPLVLATTVYFVLNTGLVAGAVVIDTGREFLPTWRESSLWTGVSAYAGLTLAAGLLVLLEVVGPSGLALGVPPCWLLAAFYRTHKERQEVQQQRIQQIEVLNHELEDKVAERTVELRRALSHIERANERLRTANERLTEANRAKSEFLANVSHELRTPLNAVIGFSDLLTDPDLGTLNAQQSEFIRDIHESGEHLLRLINDILDLSKIEAGKMEVHLEKVEVGRLTRDAAAMLRPQAAIKDLSLDVQLDEGVVLAMLDPGLYRQVLVNLLSNAVKFTPPGGEVRVTVSAQERDLVVSVVDSGIGIAPDDAARIFDAFYQVDGSYARNYGGTGLGLALVRRMVEMLGGTIEVSSTLGEGTRFDTRFSQCLIEDSPAPAIVTAATVAHSEPSGGERTILVVEDNPVNRKLARNVLRARGWCVIEATSGEEALRVLRRSSPDLVLMDIQLPGMDGLEVTRRIKADPATAALPIIALTAHAQLADEQRAREAGCIGYITKPIRLTEFPGQVEGFLRSGQPLVEVTSAG